MATVEAERSRRETMWANLLTAGGPSGLPARLLREVGVYGGAQGVWVDTDRTRGINGAGGITVGLLHTGRHYADELSAWHTTGDCGRSTRVRWRCDLWPAVQMRPSCALPVARSDISPSCHTTTL
jgi:hypothetical protein